jgi:hypothetical protein
MGRRDLSRHFVCLGLSDFASQRQPCYFHFMTKLEQIEKSVAALSSEELKAFAKWFKAFQGDIWDAQIEADAKAGRLDKLTEKALVEVRAGRARPL